MILGKPLRAQLLAMTGDGLLVTLLIALASFSFLSEKLLAYHKLFNGPIQASRLVDEANLKFNVQVQEWKNVLLRGKSPEALSKYWQSFENQEHKVQDILARLVERSELNSALSDEIRGVREEHRSLGVAYRAGRDAYIANGNDPVGDKAVQGIDRATSDQLSALVDKLHDSALRSSVEIGDAADRAVIVGSLIMLVAGALVAFLSLWLVNRNLIDPIRQLIGHIAKLSQGNFDERVDSSRADELGHLASAANILRDFLAETFTRLQRSTSDLDSASGELNAIATLMGQGTRGQFSRTDQVATAMHEMSATAQEVARQAADAARAADAADHSAQQGENMMRSTIQTITQHAPRDQQHGGGHTPPGGRHRSNRQGIGRHSWHRRPNQFAGAERSHRSRPRRRCRPRICRCGGRSTYAGQAHRRLHRRNSSDYKYGADRCARCGASDRNWPNPQRRRR